jgi:hypothetical protein
MQGTTPPRPTGKPPPTITHSPRPHPPQPSAAFASPPEWEGRRQSGPLALALDLAYAGVLGVPAYWGCCGCWSGWSDSTGSAVALGVVPGCSGRGCFGGVCARAGVLPVEFDGTAVDGCRSCLSAKRRQPRPPKRAAEPRRPKACGWVAASDGAAEPVIHRLFHRSELSVEKLSLWSAPGRILSG